MFQRIIVIATVLFLSGVMSLAQTVKGTVKDPAGEPVPGAYVIPDGQTEKGTVTDINGCFTVDASKFVTVSFIGFMNQDVSVEGKSEILIILKEDSTLLEETVVIGYGSVRKSDLTGAVSSVGGMSSKIRLPQMSDSFFREGCRESISWTMETLRAMCLSRSEDSVP